MGDTSLSWKIVAGLTLTYRVQTTERIAHFFKAFNRRSPSRFAEGLVEGTEDTIRYNPEEISLFQNLFSIRETLFLHGA